MGHVRRVASIIVAGTVLGALACSSNSNDNSNGNNDGGGDSSVAGGEGGGGDGGRDGGSTAFALTIPAFSDGSALPSAQTCEGKPFGGGVSPELDWTAGPSGTKSYAIVLKDLSLVNGPVPDHAYHWAVWDIPASTLKLPAMVASQQFLPGMAPAQQYNGGPFPSPYAYFGPCPSWMTYCDPTVPKSNDSYAFVVYAMSSATAAVPAVDAGSGNYVRTLDAYFQTAALAQTALHFTSDAVPTSIPFPCPTSGDAASSDGPTGDSAMGDGGGDATASDAGHEASPGADATRD
jgi:phosphatidylethanolamine-binding protein (PEBP) family uncharacterized protein